MSAAGYTPEEPIAAIATALSPAALGIVRCSGTGVIELLAPLFSRPKALLAAAGNSIVYGWLVEPASSGQPDNREACRRIDQVLVSVFRSPRSFTGEDMVEISCHGGPGMVAEIFRLLTAHGFRAALPGEFTFRSFINGKADLTRAEAVQEIIAAKTDLGRGRAAGRLAGGLFQELDAIKQLLRETLAAIEAEIEYPEDEEAIADAFDSRQLEEARRRLESLCSSWACEKLYQDGARVVLCGRTNAGKSSLFNTLLKEDRSIVSDIHGTTRDWIEGWVSLAGIPARLFDTAGLRESDDEVERHGIQRTQDLTAEADLILYLVDATVGLTDEDRHFLAGHGQVDASPGSMALGRPPLILVLNKWDKFPDDASIPPAPDIQSVDATVGLTDEDRDFLAGHGLVDASPSSMVLDRPPLILVLNKWDRMAQAGAAPGVEEGLADAVVHLSARTGEGTGVLVEEIRRLLFRDTGQGTAGQVGLGTERQRKCAQAALEAVAHGLEAARDGYSLDAVVQDVEESLEALGEITGEVTPEDILDTVFSRFCLGK